MHEILIEDENLLNDFQCLLDLALKEDLGKEGDVTSKAIFSDEIGNALLFSKDEGVLAGSPFFMRVFTRIDPEIAISFEKKEGDNLWQGERVARLAGRMLSLLSGERIALNFLSYLSGIAGATRKYVQKSSRSGKTGILDTRKTLPGYRRLAKYAVRIGGGSNHRMGLYDMVLIKDNHIDAAGSITRAVAKVRETYGGKYRIEVECRSIAEVREALGLKVDIIMLDNMDSKTVAEALYLPHRGVYFEASGNVNLETLEAYSSLGLDYISVGKLTHSVIAHDFSVLIEK
ncbi:MAG: carboxylating nicotinate-nucleotide diphosphorylase [Spirochaetota bacterium]